MTAVDDVTVDMLPVWSMLAGWAINPSSYAAGKSPSG